MTRWQPDDVDRNDGEGRTAEVDRLEEGDTLARYIDDHPPRPTPTFEARRKPVHLALEQLYAFEGRWPGRHTAAKSEAIITELRCSDVRYYQLLNAAVDTPEALELDPMLTRRLLDQRDVRAARRAARTTFTTRTR